MTPINCSCGGSLRPVYVSVTSIAGHQTVLECTCCMKLIIYIKDDDL